MLGLFYNKVESSQDGNSKAAKKRGAQAPGNARYGRHKTVELGKSAAGNEQALRSQACRYRARNVVSVAGQSITDQGGSSLSQRPGSLGQGAAQASSAGLNGFGEGSPHLKQVKHSQSLPHRDASAGSAPRSRGRYDRSGARQSTTQMKHTRGLLANQGTKHPLIMEISPDPNLLLQQQPVQLSSANKAQIKLVNQAGGTARSFQAQLNSHLLKTKQKQQPDEAWRPVRAGNNRSSVERLEAKKSTGKRKNASSSLVANSRSGQAAAPGLHVGGWTPDGLSRNEAQVKATSLYPPRSFENMRKTEGNIWPVAQDTARNFNPVATPLRTPHIENDRVAGCAAARDSRIGSDQSDPRTPLHPTRSKTLKPRQPKREKKASKKHANANAHSLSVPPGQARPEWRKGKTPLVQTVKYRAEPNNNKGQTNLPVYANKFGQSLDGGIPSSSYGLPRLEKDDLCHGAYAPMLNQQSPSLSPLMTPLSSQNALTCQQQRPGQLPQERQRAPIPPMINITRKAAQSPHRGAEFRKTLTEIADKSKKQLQGSSHVSGRDIATAHNRENVPNLQRISEIAEEQHTHAASLAELPVQNLAQEKGAPILLDTQTNDRHQAPVADRPKRLDFTTFQSSGLPSQARRTNLQEQLGENPRNEHAQIQSHEEDLDEATSNDGAAPLYNSALTPDHPRRQGGAMQHSGSYDPVSTALLQGINAHSGSGGSRQIQLEDGADGTASKMQNLVNRTAYFNESSEAMGTPHGRHEPKHLVNEQQHEQAQDGSAEDDVAPGPGGAEPGCQGTRITIVTAPAARKQQRQATMGPQISSSQDASMFRSNGSIGATIPMRNSAYGQTHQARTEDHRGRANNDYPGPGSKTATNEHGDIESAQNPSNRQYFVNSVEYQAGQTSKDTLLSGGEKSAHNQLRFTLADSANADDHMAPAKARPPQVDDSADLAQLLAQPKGSYETQGAAVTPSGMNLIDVELQEQQEQQIIIQEQRTFQNQQIAKKQVRLSSNYSSVDHAVNSRPELIISNQGRPILQVKTKQFKPNQVEPTQSALEKEPAHLKSKSLPDAGKGREIDDEAAGATRTPVRGAEAGDTAGTPQLQETGDAHDASSGDSDSAGTDLDDSAGLDDTDKDGKDDDMGDTKMNDGQKTCTGKVRELWREFLFRPSSAFKIKWDIIVIILSIWNSIEIPFEFAFPESFEGATTINAVDKVIDALFVFDILVNFRTMYVDPKTDLMIEDPKKISKNYIQGRFWIDLVASIPFEVFAVFLENDDGTTGNETTLKIFGMLKLVRLMRLGRMVSFMKTNKSFKLSIILVQLLFILILVIHWIACVWYGVTGLEGGNTWIPPKDVDWDSTIIYSETDFQVYNVFFYYSVLTLVTNELMPTNNIEILSAICILLTGSLVIGILIGEFSSIMSDMSETANRQNEELDMMTSVMMGLKLPEEIQLNVLDYYLALQSCKYVHNDQVYDYLNKCITNTVKHFQVEHWVIQSQLIHEDNQSLILQFASLTTMEYFQQNEIVIKQNDLSDNFYLICEGIVEVAQEARDFTYYDYAKKKRFLEQQIVINQRRRKLSQRRRSQRRSAGVSEFDELTQFQNAMDIKPFFANSKDSREEEGPGGARSGLPTANQEDTAAHEAGFRVINELTEGDYFGEIAMVTNLRRTCSVYTVSNGFFAVIGKAQFLELANANVDLKHKLYNKINAYKDENFKASVTMIKNVPSFRPLAELCLRKIAYRLRDERFSRGQKILRTGEHCDKVYFVRSGRVQVYVKDMSESSNQSRWHRLTTLKAGDCFNFVGAVLQRPAIFEFVSETLPGLNVKTQHESRSTQRQSKGFTPQQLEQSEASSRDSERSQDQEGADILSGDDRELAESQPLGAGSNEAARETKYEGGQPEAPAGTGARSQPQRTQPGNDGQRHLPPPDSARWQSAGLGSKELINCDKLNQQIGAEAGLAGRSSQDFRVSERGGTRARNSHALGARAGPIGQEQQQTGGNPRYPRVVEATSHQKPVTVSAGSMPNSISRMISRSLNFSQEPGENDKEAAPPGSEEPIGAFGAAAGQEESSGEYEVLDNTAQLYSLSREALMELADLDEHIHNAIVNVKNIYRGQHIKYDYSNLLYKNTKELTVAQHAKDMQEYNEFGELDSHFFFCTSFLQKLKMQMLRKKILRFAKFMLHRNIKMNDVEVFKHVDANYHHFVGRDKNLPLNLILHNGFYNQTSQGKLFKFIEQINEKNTETAKTVTPAEKMDERDLNMNKDKSVFDNEKEYSQFSKQTALNVNTLRRYKEQEHFQQNLINKPAEALERILEQAMENVQNVDIVRQNVEELHFENYYKLTQLEKWVDKIATQYRTVVQKREGSQRGGAPGLQSRQIGQAAGNFKERQGNQALTPACAGSTGQTLKPLPESAEYKTPSQGAENDNLDQDFALTSPEKTKAMTLAEFKEIEKQAEDLDIDSMLRDVEDIEKKIRKTINQSVAEQEKISVERHLTERQQRHAIDTKQYYVSSKEKSASPMNKSKNYQQSPNAANGLPASPERGPRFTSGTQNNGNFQDKHRAANIPERGRSQEPRKLGQSRDPYHQPTQSSRGANSKESDFHGPVEIVASPKVGNSIKRETNAAFHSPRRQRDSGNQGAEDANASFNSSARARNDLRGYQRPGQQINSQVSIPAPNGLDQSGSLHRNAAAAGPVPIPSSTLRSAALAGLGNVPNLNNTNVTYTNESGQHSIGEPRASLGSHHPRASGGRRERTARVDLDLNKFYSDNISQPNAADAAESRFVHTLDSQPSHRSHNPSFSFQVAADGKAHASPSPADRARVVKTQSSRDSQYVQYGK